MFYQIFLLTLFYVAYIFRILPYYFPLFLIIVILILSQAQKGGPLFYFRFKVANFFGTLNFICTLCVELSEREHHGKVRSKGC